MRLRTVSLALVVCNLSFDKYTNSDSSSIVLLNLSVCFILSITVSSKQVGSQISLSSVIALSFLVPCSSSLLLCAGYMGADTGISLPCSYTNPVYICWMEKDHGNRKIQQSKNIIYYECSEDSNWLECCLKGNNQPDESQDKYFCPEIDWSVLNMLRVGLQL